MPLTTLDPKTALIIVDLQKGVVGLPTVHPTEDIVKNSRTLADAFRTLGLPVVLVNVNAGAPGRIELARPGGGERPADWADLVPELDQQPSDLTVTKHSWGAFHETDLADRLKALGVTQVVVTGVSTSSGVESTARQAYEHGFNVTVATDAVTDMNPEVHENSVTRIFPKLGETGTTAEIVELLAGTHS
jgi:nicotinamidase-related amidase